MERSLSHLPDYKQEEIKIIVSIIRSVTKKTELIILFGSTARGDSVEDRYVEDRITYEYRSDYDILVVVQNHTLANLTSLWHRVHKKIAKTKTIHTNVNLIVHDIDEINHHLRQGNYFFSDIKKEGILLYDSGKCTLAESRPIPVQERKKLAEEDFSVWYGNAKGFLRQYHHAIQDNDLLIAAFDLHQAAERFLCTVIIVFSHYKPKTHDIERLLSQAAQFDDQLLSVFPRKTQKEQRCFNLLRKAYLDSRYSKVYTVKPAELEYLAERVEKLDKLSAAICRKRLETLG